MLLKNVIKGLYRSQRYFYGRAVKEVCDEIPPLDVEVLHQRLQASYLNTTEEWKSFREQFLADSKNHRHPLTAASFDANVIASCMKNNRYDLAFSYINALKDQKIEPNLVTVSRLFMLFQNKYWDIGVTLEEETVIRNLYKKLRQQHKILDTITLEYLLAGLSVTSNWKACFKILEEIKQIQPPSDACVSSAVAGAFLHGDEQRGWGYLMEMLRNNQTPKPIVYSAYFKNTQDAYELECKCDRLFSCLRKNYLNSSQQMGYEVVREAQKYGIPADLVSITSSGKCSNCNQKLQKLFISAEDFATLKQEILSKVIVGRDVFRKTDPSEVERFNTFVNRIGHYDVIVDGLNVAYSTGHRDKKTMTHLVRAVVRYFVKHCNFSVLLLGRTHMQSWFQQHWSNFEKDCTSFFTRSLSQDDPYLLYCALHSGQDTIIISRDLMRSHSFLIDNVRRRAIFRRWLDEVRWSLIKVNNFGVPVFEKPPPYGNMCQKVGLYWHVPCYENHDDPGRWLCIKCNSCKLLDCGKK